MSQVLSHGSVIEDSLSESIIHSNSESFTFRRHVCDRLRHRWLVASCLACLPLQAGTAPAPSFVNFETAPVHPVALSPDGGTLAVCNLPDARLELFDVTGGSPSALGAVPVGMDPVSVRFRTADEIWVVNHISASVNIIDLPARRITATLQTLPEPCDVVFAGQPERAFVSCAGPDTVQVFDPRNRVVETNLLIQGERPKAMAVSPDKSRVYVAIFESGNGTTILAPPFTINLPEPGPLGDPAGPYGGENPPPNAGLGFDPPLNPEIPADKPPPPVSHIVRKNEAGRWMDDNGRDWTEYVSGTNAPLAGRVEGWDLVDRDVAVIEADTGAISYIGRLMNLCMDLAVHPVSGRIAVVGTDATNERRFEPNLRATFLRVQLALADPDSSARTILDLNPHLDYVARTIPPAERKVSLGDPRGIVWHSGGTLGYVAGMGSRNVAMIDGEGNRVRAEPIELEEGPCGLALDEERQRLFVLNRFSSSLSVVDTVTHTVLTNMPLFDPTPAAIKRGRSFLYDTRDNSGLGHVSCASCHVDARMDRLAWDLGNPAGDFLTVTNYSRSYPSVFSDFAYHPMKGPMVTQTFQDILGHEPFHWRGDRRSIETFNPTFVDLLGRDTQLTEEEMDEFKEELRSIHFPPNPFRDLDGTLPESVPLPGLFGVIDPDKPLGSGNPRRGFDMFFFNSGGDNQCRACHERSTGLSHDDDVLPGPDGEAHFLLRPEERTFRLPFKIPQLRNIHEKVGLDYDRASSRSGFGFTHDGRMDTLAKFLFFGSTDPVRYFVGSPDGDEEEEERVLDVDRNIADLTAFLFCFSGRDPEMHRLPDADDAVSLEVAAASGRQLTATSPDTPMLDTFLRLADSPSNRLDLVVRGEMDGLGRGWYYAGDFISDRRGESLSAVALRAMASSANPLTFMLVPRGLGRRLGIDRDEDGWPDRTEMEEGYDSADRQSPAMGVPPRVTLETDYLSGHGGMELTFSPEISDPDTPVDEIVFDLLPGMPAGASLDPSTGQFTWRLPVSLDASGMTRLYLRATEAQWPFHSDIEAVTLEYGPLGFNILPRDNRNAFGLEWRMIPGWDYTPQYVTNLAVDVWTDWHRTYDAIGRDPVVSTRDPFPDAPRKYFRLRLDPR